MRSTGLGLLFLASAVPGFYLIILLLFAPDLFDGAAATLAQAKPGTGGSVLLALVLWLICWLAGRALLRYARTSLQPLRPQGLLRVVLYGLLWGGLVALLYPTTVDISGGSPMYRTLVVLGRWVYVGVASQLAYWLAFKLRLPAQ